MDRVKGLQKDYDMWMEDQLNDYVLPVDKTKSEHSKLDKKIENATTVVSNHHSPQKLKASPVKKISLQNCDFIQFWTQFPLKLLLKFLWFLTPGEIIKLSWTCKQAHNTLNTQDIWTYLFTRFDPTYSVPDLTGIDARLYYKYYLYTQWIGTLYHTGYLYQPEQHDDPSIAELTKNIVDFALVKSTKMKYLLREELKIEEHCIDDLKLSLYRETNEVYIWLTGLELEVKGVKPSEIPIPSPLILRVFSCKENEFIKDTFFLGETFLVLEIGKQIEASGKPIQKEEEQKNEGQTHSSVPKYYSSFVIYNLQDEIRSLVLDDGETTLVPSSSIRCNFSTGTNGINKSILNVKDTKVHDIIIDNISEDGKLEVRLLNEEEIIFITTDTKLPEAVVINTSMNKVHRKTIELENTMKKLINSTKDKESHKIMLYVADDKENVLNITFNQDTSPEIKNVVEQAEGALKEKIPLEKRFVETIKKYHYGSYKNTIKDISGDYLILFNGKVFTFIDVSRQKTCEFSSDKDFYNWTVFENKLCLLCSDNIRLFNISFGDEQGPQITHIGCTTFDEPPQKCQFRWIMMNPCFTVIIDASQRTAGNSPILKLMVGSTQWLFYCAETLTKYEHWISDRKGTLKKWGSKEITLENFLEEKLEKWEIMPDLKQENFSTKFEGEKLLIKGEKYNIFFDFVVKTERQRLYPRYKKINLSQIFAVEPSSEKKKNEEKRKIYLVHHESLRENKNQGDKRLDSISHNWKKKDGDDDEKEGKVTKKTSPNKGKKYFKNVRQDSRQRKTDI